MINLCRQKKLKFILIFLLVFWLLPPVSQATNLTPEKNMPTEFKIPILMYHYVETNLQPTDEIRQRLTVTPDYFADQLKSLQSANYQSWFVQDVPDLLTKELLPGPNKKPVVLTFDDGYEDFYTVAFPLLKKYNFKATIYIIYNLIDHRGYLTTDQIKELIASGLVEVGSHTLNHPNLKTVSNEVLRYEIEQSKAKLERKFDLTIKTFAYPYGAFSPTALAEVQAAGYTAAVSTHPGTYQTVADLFQLNRVRVLSFSGKHLVQMLDHYFYDHVKNGTL